MGTGPRESKVPGSPGPLRNGPLGPSPLDAQSGAQSLYQVPYNGYFTFTRVRYGGGGGFRGFGGSSAWNHDYPYGIRNLQFIVDEFTHLRTNTEGTNVLDLEDPRIFQYPILYMSEPGYWSVSDEGALNLREFLLKGGFLIFDDFELQQWDNMAAQMRRAVPDYVWFELDPSHPIFRSYWVVEDIYVPHPAGSSDSQLPGDVRGQRSDEEGDGPRQPQLRPGGVLGVSRRTFRARSHERRVSARRELPHLRNDALSAVLGPRVP